MDVKTTFKRYEYKYLLNANQFEKIFAELNKHMLLDDYGEMTIRNTFSQNLNIKKTKAWSR